MLVLVPEKVGIKFNSLTCFNLVPTGMPLFMGHPASQVVYQQ